MALLEESEANGLEGGIDVPLLIVDEVILPNRSILVSLKGEDCPTSDTSLRARGANPIFCGIGVNDTLSCGGD